MNCFPCFSSKKDENENNNQEVPVAQVKEEPPVSAPPQPPVSNNAEHPPLEANNHHDDNEAKMPENGNNGARTFTFRELAMATKNFRQEHLLGEGGFGKVYKGTLQTGEVVAVKRLDRNGTQGSKEFLVEVLMLTLLKHPNLVNLLGYCADGEQRLLVYEYLPLGSLKSYLHDLSEDKKPLDWKTRMKLASAAAEGLEYLHEKANPPVVFRDLKLSNILLDEDFNPKLSDYGLAKLAQGDTKMHMTPRVMGSNGYCAPEYESHSEFTTKSDIYSFGVILLELITGRKALDTEKPTDEQSLVSWAKPFFKDPKRFPEMADPLLKREFPERGLNQAVGIAAMCLQDEPSVRPLIGDLVSLLGFLAVAPPEESIPPNLSIPNPPSEAKSSGEDEDDSDHSDSSDHEDGENEYTSNSDYESGSSDGSDHEDGGNAENEDEDSQPQIHRKSQKIGSKSSSSKRKDKMGKRDSNKLSRKATKSHKIKKEEGNNRSASIASSSSE